MLSPLPASLATLAGGLFTGAAVSLTLVEQPAGNDAMPSEARRVLWAFLIFVFFLVR